MDLAQEVKREVTEFIVSPKKRFNPLANCTTELTLEVIACALRDVCEESGCLVHSAIPKRTVAKDTVKSVLPNQTSLEDMLLKATSDTEFLLFHGNITKQDIQ